MNGRRPGPRSANKTLAGSARPAAQGAAAISNGRSLPVGDHKPRPWRQEATHRQQRLNRPIAIGAYRPDASAPRFGTSFPWAMVAQRQQCRIDHVACSDATPCDNAPALVSGALRQWARTKGIRTEHIRPGSQTVHAESCHEATPAWPKWLQMEFFSALKGSDPFNSRCQFSRHAH